MSSADPAGLPKVVMAKCVCVFEAEHMRIKSQRETFAEENLRQAL